ncbi:TetR family transcriptional regulator [Rathayibacter sp. VKM Ac-2804]|uniref:TetR/AcrR family transcriptional regulator n=1 Tax=unclassified Rathayibacter TaxID=2609250 RepID=UPI00132E8302|nr:MULTISPECIES: TetR/AcrR family transcriptional regulator [unclassified Rathayibacter]NRG42333.1 helix-turn-helix transcriptional regulator [Rathayibacter sp. VKM Ac-2835]QHF22834.1 TetR family transcriptional regulator [Rathayibacter sp. VKM Ac-2804]
MPRLKDSTRLERRRRIAAAALDCFAENGIAGTTMADIIRASGLSSGAIYSHFDSKADLLRYVMSTMLEERFTAIGDAPEAAPAPTPEALVARLLDGAAADRSRTSVLVQVWGEIARDGDLAAVAEENLAHLRTLLVGGLRPWAEQRDGAELGLATATRTADLVIAVSFGYATLLALRPSVDPEELRGHLLGALRLSG